MMDDGRGLFLRILFPNSFHRMFKFAYKEMAKVMSLARSPFNTVASMYRPLSVKTLVDLRLLGDTFDIKIFDFIIGLHYFALGLGQLIFLIFSHFITIL